MCAWLLGVYLYRCLPAWLLAFLDEGLGCTCMVGDGLTEGRGREGNPYVAYFVLYRRRRGGFGGFGNMLRRGVRTSGVLGILLLLFRFFTFIPMDWYLGICFFCVVDGVYVCLLVYGNYWGYGAGHLKSTKNLHKNNLRKFSATTTSLRRYDFIEFLRRHSSLILCFLILNQSNISGDSKISNYPCMMVFEDTFAKPHYFVCIM